jgi:hypothetical protein
MSILETPRLYFRGQMAWDPITTNNTSSRYDEGDAVPMYGEAGTVEQFREAAIAAGMDVVNRNWNPDGTHRSTFFDTSVSGADIGDGLVAEDPFVGAPASFTGMLVDCEPYGSVSSQLFFDSMTFGVNGGYRIQLPRTSRVTARYINFSRYLDGATSFIAGVASVNWQTSFLKTEPLFRIDPYDSPSLRALAAAVDAPDVAGLVVRWNVYRTIYFDDPDLSNADQGPPAAAAAALIAKLRAGGWQPNPARSLLVGAIGLWRQGEPAHEPCGRALITSNPSVATAHARLAGNVLTVDLSNSICETGPDLAKQDLGTLHFVAASADGSTVKELGKIDYADYDRVSYDQTSGIVTVNVDVASAAEFAATADIQLRSDDGSGAYGNTIYLEEEALRAIPTQPNLYVDYDYLNPTPVTAQVQVFYRGARVGAGVPVRVLGGPSFNISTVAWTDADGVAEFSYVYSGTSYGACEAFVFQTDDNLTLPAGVNPLVTTYMYIRSVPTDDKTGALDPTWDNVYRAVLSKWKAMAPCMDNWLDLGNEAQVLAYAPLLKKLTDPANFEAFRFMPVTRDMTVGERALLYNFLGGTQPAPRAMMVKEKAAAAPDARPNIGQLSRAMRGG